MVIIRVQARGLLELSSSGGEQGKKGIMNLIEDKIILVITGISEKV